MEFIVILLLGLLLLLILTPIVAIVKVSNVRGELDATNQR